MNRPIKDCIAYLSNNHGVFLQPLNLIRKLVFFSPHNKAEVNGYLGFISIRGRQEEAFEKQLARQSTSNISYNSKMTYHDLLKDYTHVVLATGDGAYSIEQQQYRIDLTVSLRGATIEGNFDPQKVIAWFNNDFAPKGYAYLIPFSEQEANIVIAYPDYADYEVNVLWDRFLKVVKRDIGQDFGITDNFSITKYIMGSAQKGRVGNTFFTGNCLGTMMPFLGFGQFTSILSGIYAAQDIGGVANYEDKIVKIRESYRYSLILRRFMESLSDENLDALVKFIATPIGQRGFSWQWLNVLKFTGIILGPWFDTSRKMRVQNND